MGGIRDGGRWEVGDQWWEMGEKGWAMGEKDMGDKGEGGTRVESGNIKTKEDN